MDITSNECMICMTDTTSFLLPCCKGKYVCHSCIPQMFTSKQTKCENQDDQWVIFDHKCPFCNSKLPITEILLITTYSSGRSSFSKFKVSSKDFREFRDDCLTVICPSLVKIDSENAKFKRTITPGTPLLLMSDSELKMIKIPTMTYDPVTGERINFAEDVDSYIISMGRPKVYWIPAYPSVIESYAKKNHDWIIKHLNAIYG